MNEKQFPSLTYSISHFVVVILHQVCYHLLQTEALGLFAVQKKKKVAKTPQKHLISITNYSQVIHQLHKQAGVSD